MLGKMKISTSRAFLELIRFCICIVMLGVAIAACANKTENDSGGEKEMSSKTIEQVLKEHTEELMSLPGVVGTAQGLCDAQPCIKIFVIKKTKELENTVKGILEGYPVVIEETGRIRPRPEKRD